MIYYYDNETAPLYLFMAYAKAAQENPSPAAVATLAKLAEAAKAGAIGAATTKVAYNLKGGPVDLQSSNLCKPPDNPGSRSYFIPAVTELPNNLKISGTDTVEPGTDS